MVLALLLTISAVLLARAFTAPDLATARDAPGWRKRSRIYRFLWSLTDPFGTTLFVVYAGTAVLWLSLGLAPAIAAASPSLHATLHEWGRGAGWLSGVAARIANASHGAEGPGQVALDYLFSALNLGLGSFLVFLKPRDLTARLLAVGMIGTAVAFNLQGHDALQVFPPAWLGVVGGWHDAVHVVSGVHYIYALLLFPAGTLLALHPERDAQTKVPFLVLIALLFALVSAWTVEEHTVGLVFVFGVLTPVAGVVAQARRYRHASSPEQRQQSRLLLMALSVSLGAAACLLGVSIALSPPRAQETVTYEFAAPGPSTYFFRCDPHPDTMFGFVTVLRGESSPEPLVVRMSAANNRFDRRELLLTAGRLVSLRFTNRDADAHNVAIYRTRGAQEAIFVGKTFSGNDLAARVFRLFRVVFFVLPLALFIGILRFRLWDVDRIINRALVYTVLTGILGLLYFAVVLVLERVVRTVTPVETNEVARVASTLAVAALFQPVRRRVQALIDQRFFRRRYDAALTIEAFSARLRQHIDLEALTRELVSVTRATMQPSHVSLWLAPPPQASRASPQEGRALGRTPSAAGQASGEAAPERRPTATRRR